MNMRAIYKLLTNIYILDNITACIFQVFDQSDLLHSSLYTRQYYYPYLCKKICSNAKHPCHRRTPQCGQIHLL